jgi:tRNA(adenine34) deaminase
MVGAHQILFAIPTVPDNLQNLSRTLMKIAIPLETFDEWAMEKALTQAKKAEARGEVPVGAVITSQNKLISKAGNAVISRMNPTAHAEILAISTAAKKTGNYRLSACTLYCTLEPCIMCVGAILHARITRVIYSCPDDKWGGLESIIKFSKLTGLNHTFAVEKGLGADQSRKLLQDFFRQKRHGIKVQMSMAPKKGVSRQYFIG